MIPVELEQLHRNFWNISHGSFNLSTTEGCGKYTETWVIYAKNHGFLKCENLKKHPGQTQWNGHAVDAFIYCDGEGNPNGLYCAVDLIGGAEGPNPTINWGVDIPRYTDADIWVAGNPIPAPGPKMVPYVPYEGDNYWNNQVGKVLYWDYTDKTRANRPGLDSMSSVWTARTIHDIKMEGLTPQASVDKHRIEWCAELKIPVVPVPPEVLNG